MFDEVAGTIFRTTVAPCSLDFLLIQWQKFRNLRALVIETKHGDPRPKHSTHTGPDLLNTTVFLAETHSCAELVLLVHPVAHAKIASSSR